MFNIEERINQSVANLSESPIRLFDQQVSSIEGIIRLTLGEPDFPTPDHVKAAGIDAIKNNHTTYTASPGQSDLLFNASQYMIHKYDLTYNPDTEIIATVGATEALSTAFETIINPGDKILVPSPMFSMYLSMIRIQGGEPILIDTSDNDFVLSPQMVEDAMEEHGDQVKGIILNYPTNPTGITLKPKEAQALADVIGKYAIFVISDEIYSELVYEGDHVSLASYLPEQTIIVNGVSKSHAMTGWRLGLLFAPENIMTYLKTVHQAAVTSATSISQAAASEALLNGRDDTKIMLTSYRLRRDFIYNGLTRLGFDIASPNGAFYLFAKIPADFEQNSYDFCLELAKEAQVALIPGSSFGIGGENYVRLSYAASMDDLETAMNRITKYIEKQRQSE